MLVNTEEFMDHSREFLRGADIQENCGTGWSLCPRDAQRDGTLEERPEAETSEDRGSIPVSNLPLADTPISIG
jgi:hypothetical protein